MAVQIADEDVGEAEYLDFLLHHRRLTLQFQGVTVFGDIDKIQRDTVDLISEGAIGRGEPFEDLLVKFASGACTG